MIKEKIYARLLVPLAILLSTISIMSAQPGAISTFTIQEAQELAVARQPLLAGSALLTQLEDLQLQEIEISRLPSIALRLEGTLQSETVSFPEDSPLPIEIDLPLFGARAYLDLQYLAYDGGLAKAKESVTTAGTMVAQQELIVQADKIRGQVNDLYLNILLLQKQQEILQLNLFDLQAMKEVINSRVENGVLLPAERDRLRVREMELENKLYELRSAKDALLDVLSYLCGRPLDREVLFLLPTPSYKTTLEPPQNQELTLFQLQREQLQSTSALSDAKRRPKVGVFAKAGAGYPNPLNLFDNTLSPYALGGISLQWNLFDWGQQDLEKDRIQLQSQMLQVQEDQFRWMLDTGVEKHQEETATLEYLLERDEELVSLQDDILMQLESQLENGVVTASEYLLQFNAKHQAELNRELHQIQLIQKQIEFNRSRGYNW